MTYNKLNKIENSIKDIENYIISLDDKINKIENILKYNFYFNDFNVKLSNLEDKIKKYEESNNSNLENRIEINKNYNYNYNYNIDYGFVHNLLNNPYIKILNNNNIDIIINNDIEILEDYYYNVQPKLLEDIENEIKNTNENIFFKNYIFNNYDGKNINYNEDLKIITIFCNKILYEKYYYENNNIFLKIFEYFFTILNNNLLKLYEKIQQTDIYKDITKYYYNNNIYDKINIELKKINIICMKKEIYDYNISVLSYYLKDIILEINLLKNFKSYYYHEFIILFKNIFFKKILI